MCKGTGGIEEAHESAQSGPYAKADVAEVSEVRRWRGWNLKLDSLRCSLSHGQKPKESKPFKYCLDGKVGQNLSAQWRVATCGENEVQTESSSRRRRTSG